MKAKSQFSETVIANALVAIFEQLDTLGKAVNILASQHLTRATAHAGPQPLNAEQAALLERLGRLTLKRHVVLTATLGKVGYQELADIMDCDSTTVKLHLKGAMNLLNIPNRSSLLANHLHMLDAIPDQVYEGRYGLAKRWWLSPSPELMAVLRATKRAGNQHTR